MSGFGPSVWIRRWKLFGLAGLHHIGPLGQFEATLAFQVLREGLDELLRLHILEATVEKFLLRLVMLNDASESMMLNCLMTMMLLTNSDV